MSHRKGIVLNQIVDTTSAIGPVAALLPFLLIAATLLCMSAQRKAGRKGGDLALVGHYPIPAIETLTKAFRFAVLRLTRSKGIAGPSQGGPDPASGHEFISWSSVGTEAHKRTKDCGWRTAKNKETFNSPSLKDVQGFVLSYIHEFTRMGFINVVMQVLACVCIGPFKGKINAVDTPDRTVNDCLTDYFGSKKGPKDTGGIRQFWAIVGPMIESVQGAYEACSKHADPQIKFSRLAIMYELKAMLFNSGTNPTGTVGELRAHWRDQHGIGLAELLDIRDGHSVMTFTAKDDEAGGLYEKVQKAYKKRVQVPTHDLTNALGVLAWVKDNAEVNKDDIIEDDAIRAALTNLFNGASFDGDTTVWLPQGAETVEQAVEMSVDKLGAMLRL